MSRESGDDARNNPMQPFGHAATVRCHNLRPFFSCSGNIRRRSLPRHRFLFGDVVGPPRTYHLDIYPGIADPSRGPSVSGAVSTRHLAVAAHSLIQRLLGLLIYPTSSAVAGPSVRSATGAFPYSSANEAEGLDEASNMMARISPPVTVDGAWRRCTQPDHLSLGSAFPKKTDPSRRLDRDSE
jgi:hypothetical protein